MTVRQTLVNFFAAIIQSITNVIMNTTPAHEIIPGIWLGNKGASQDRQFMMTNQINTVFNCTKDLPFMQGGPTHMYRIPVDDNLQADEIRNLEHWSWEICFKIAKERAGGNRMLIHCFAGMQRSAAVVAMYLISTYRCSTDEAVAFIKSKRPVAFYGNVNFYPAIKGFETGFQKMIADTGKYSSYPKIPLPIDTITNT